MHHVQETIRHYGEALTPFDLKRFNGNIIDPVKLAFDKSVYGYTWEELIQNEIFRQRDKANNNAIGYFHQQIHGRLYRSTGGMGRYLGWRKNSARMRNGSSHLRRNEEQAQYDELRIKRKNVHENAGTTSARR